MAKRGESLTEPQRRALAFLRANDGLSPRELAKLMWPDSPGWRKRSRRGATDAGGALGATMPMKAGAVIARLRRAGVYLYEVNGRWRA